MARGGRRQRPAARPVAGGGGARAAKSGARGCVHGKERRGRERKREERGKKGVLTELT